MDDRTRKFVYERSGRLCEAFIEEDGFAYRCDKPANGGIHHMLTKARGGEHLDRFTHYHLIHLCSECHRASDGAEAYEGGLLIEGRVEVDRLTGKPIYVGPDEFLSTYFGPEDVDVAPEDRRWFL